VMRNNGKTVVEGYIPSRCSLRPLKVSIELSNITIVRTSCECGESLCRHARLLYTEYFASLRRGLKID